MSPLHTVLLVEGESDRVAVETLGSRLGRDLRAEGVEVRPLGGATNAPRVIAEVVADSPALRITGLYDTAEERMFRRGLRRAGFGDMLGPDDLARLGFFACVDDLEDELIRSLGPDTVVDVIAAAGEMSTWDTMRRQPAQAGRAVHDQLHRFMGTRGGRKIRYGELLVRALDLTRVPAPLERVLNSV